jgi:hypothetical protein
LHFYALLCTILLPSLTKAREKTIRAVCLSNVKQFATSSTTYAVNNNYKLSPSRGKFTSTLGIHFLHGKTVKELDPYVPSWKISNCPNHALTNTKVHGVKTNQGSVQIGYNYLAAIKVSKLKGSANSWVSPYRLTDENDLVVMVDRLQASKKWVSFVPHTAIGWRVVPKSLWNSNPAAIGSQGANQALLDGSAKWNSSSKLTPQKAASVSSFYMWWKLPEE